MAIKLRPHSKNEAEALNPEPKLEKRPIIVNYDKDGNRIGDDGYVMTKTRNRMHNLFNAIFIWGAICVVVSVVLAIASYGQGQQYTGFELDTYGGNMWNGWSIADLLRYEGLFLMFTGILTSVIQLQGTRWFYDGNPIKATAILMSALALLSVVFEAFCMFGIGIVEPAAIINAVFLFAIAITMQKVVEEKPRLKKAKVAKSFQH